jgi:hypothetical protein
MSLTWKMVRQAHHHIGNKGLFFLFVIAFSGLIADASVIAVYEDNFDGSGAVNLHGLAPDVGGNTWIAHTSWKADGTPGSYSSATLPFTPAVGKVYRLSARFKNVAGGNDWLAVGFAAGSSTGNTTNDDRFISGATAGQPWMLRRGNAATSLDQAIAGSGSSNSQDIFTLNRSSDVDFQIILDTRPTQWRVVWYQKLTSESEYSAVRNFTYSPNPSIGAVGLARANTPTTGNIDYFLLEKIEPTLSITPGGQPEDTAVFEGQTATFQVIFVSNSTPSVTWYQDEWTGDTPVNTADPNITVAVDYNSPAGEYTARLEIQNANDQYEGIYYCVINNDDNLPIQSDDARLTVKRLAANFSLNVADYDGNYLDTVEGYIAQPTAEPNFVAGVRNEPNGAAMITSSSGWGLSESFGVDLTKGFTICLWVSWNGNWQGTINVDDLVVESSESETEYVVTNGLKANHRWRQVCITYEDGWLKVYLNGQLKMTESCEMPDAYETAIAIGNDGEQQIFNGSIDDIRLYNYALSQTEITQLVTDENNCIQEYSLEYDFSGPYGLPDCVVNLYDMAEFSNHWLENCIPECSLEYDFSGPSGVPDHEVDLYDLAEFSKHWLSSGW